MSPSSRRQRGLAEIVASESDGEDVHNLEEANEQNIGILLENNTDQDIDLSAIRRKSPRKTEATSTIQKLQRSSRQSPSLQQVSRPRKTETVSSSSSVNNENGARKPRASLLAQDRQPTSTLKKVSSGTPQKAKPGRPSSQTMLQRYFLSGQTHTPAPLMRGQKNEKVEDKVQEGEEEEAEEEEWEVNRILADEIRTTAEGKQEVFYLIKWVGEWDDTWEPRKHVGRAAIKEYQDAKRTAELISKNQNGDHNHLKRKREREEQTADPARQSRRMVTGAGTLFHKKSREVPVDTLQKSTRSGSTATSISDSNRPKKQMSQHPAFHNSKSKGQTDGTEVGHSSMVNFGQRLESPAEEDAEEESLFVRQDDVPVARTFDNVDGKGNGNVQGKQSVRLGPIDIDSSTSDSGSPVRYSYSMEEVNKVVVISSGESNSDESDDDGDDDGNEDDELA